MTATDELIRLLNERGVRYELDDVYAKKYPPEKRVTWSCDIAGETVTVTARDYAIGTDDNGDWVYLLAHEFYEAFTPEQVIATTLGVGECRQEQGGWTTEGDHARVFLSCGHSCMVETVADLPSYCPTCGRKVINDG